MIRHRVLLPAALAIALGAAHDASAATITTTRPCLNAASPAQFVGAGFTPGATVRVSIGLDTVNGLVGPDGAFVAPFTAPPSDSFSPLKTVTFTADDETTMAAGSVLLTTPGATLTPDGPTRVQQHIALAGFEPGQVLYAHLRWNHKWQKTLKLGTAVAPCGSLSVKRKLLRKTVGARHREVYVQFDHTVKPATDTHQTAYARFRVNPGVAHDPENYSLLSMGWRERTGI